MVRNTLRAPSCSHGHHHHRSPLFPRSRLKGKQVSCEPAQVVSKPGHTLDRTEG